MTVCIVCDDVSVRVSFVRQQQGMQKHILPERADVSLFPASSRHSGAQGICKGDRVTDIFEGKSPVLSGSSCRKSVCGMGMPVGAEALA